jgi:hypothetical protein
MMFNLFFGQCESVEICSSDNKKVSDWTLSYLHLYGAMMKGESGKRSGVCCCKPSVVVPVHASTQGSFTRG